MTDDITDKVHQRYAELATTAAEGVTCCPPEEQTFFGASLYDRGDLDDVPTRAALASLGCGNPTAVADLHAAEVVLDLGSGGGIDVILSAGRVGPAGRADIDRWTGCIAGALTRATYIDLLETAGFSGIEITETHRVHPHAASAIIRACKRTDHGAPLITPGL